VKFTPLTIKGEAAVVILTRAFYAIVDVADWHKTCGAKWYAHRGGPSLDVWYARNGSGDFLHHVIADLPPGVRVDHKNLNRLDCRRSNLRAATASQNSSNWRRSNKIGRRGVRRQRNGRCQAMIFDGDKRRGLGTYDTPDEAAKAYDAAAKLVYGSFAILNFPTA
jgi:hypothetical protein